MEPGLPTRSLSVRWTGTLEAPFTGNYIIGVKGAVAPDRGLMHVFLDDKEIVGNSAGQGMARTRQTHIDLQAGRKYALRVEYRQPGPAGAAQLVWVPPAEPLLAAAVQAARDSDVVVACVGLNSNLEGEEMAVDVPGFHGGDRTDLNLPAPQERLIEAAIATGKPVIVVLTTGSAVAPAYAAQHAAAMLEAWYGGEAAGAAIAETLAGLNNPAGRLPVTFYAGIDQLPAFEDYSMKGRTYRYFKGNPLYGFGFGLSYSRFEYSGPRAQRTATGARISVRVKNTSSRDGDEVAQLYLAGGEGSEDPIRQLRGFERVHLRAGETRELEFNLDAKDLPQAGAKISIGGGQPVGQPPTSVNVDLATK
jgi:beta-glucosidase